MNELIDCLILYHCYLSNASNLKLAFNFDGILVGLNPDDGKRCAECLSSMSKLITVSWYLVSYVLLVV